MTEVLTHDKAIDKKILFCHDVVLEPHSIFSSMYRMTFTKYGFQYGLYFFCTPNHMLKLLRYISTMIDYLRGKIRHGNKHYPLWPT